MLRDEEHPALSTVLWSARGGRCEFAEYRGHRLRVRHLTTRPDAHGDDRLNMGWIDDEYVGSEPGAMSRICNRLFSAVDEMEGD